MMVHILVCHKVKDFSHWKDVFAEHAPVRKMAGSQGGRLFRNAQDPNEVAVLLEWDDMTKARIFLESKDLERVMERAGVVGGLGVYHEVEKVTE